TGSVSGDESIGGLVGSNGSDNTTIENSYSTGNVSGDKWVGGLISGGLGAISNCYSTGSVSGNSYVGGLMGWKSPSCPVFNSYWDTVESLPATTSAGGTGRTTIQMKQKATYAGWDFTNIWKIDEDVSYPYFN
ncbi:MAG: peptidase A26, partial [Candidatus Omnitrophica bacterium]|nr:peptidase A26 [Candidatus Omnitrophota bacterium]